MIGPPRTRCSKGFAEVAKALSSGRRAEIVDVLAQGERSVEEVAGEIDQSVANTSHHLRALARAGLLTTRRDGTRIYYALASDRVGRAVGRGARRRRGPRAPDSRSSPPPTSVTATASRSSTATGSPPGSSDGAVVVLDVRPAAEFGAGHIAGARSVPIGELRRHLKALPADAEVVAYCRGPYCVYADDAVRELDRKGFKAAPPRGRLPRMEASRPARRGRRLRRPRSTMTDNGAQIGLVLDCADPERLAEFWAPALGYVNLGTAGSYVALLPDGRRRPEAAPAAAWPNRRPSRTACTSTSRSPTSTPRPTASSPSAPPGSAKPLQRARLHLGAHDRPRGQRVLRLRRRPVPTRLTHDGGDAAGGGEHRAVHRPLPPLLLAGQARHRERGTRRRLRVDRLHDPGPGRRPRPAPRPRARRPARRHRVGLGLAGPVPRPADRMPRRRHRPTLRRAAAGPGPLDRPTGSPAAPATPWRPGGASRSAPAASTRSCTPTSCAAWAPSWRCCEPATGCCDPAAAWRSPPSTSPPASTPRSTVEPSGPARGRSPPVGPTPSSSRRPASSTSSTST